MEPRRIAGIRIPLTEEQKELIRRLTGAEVQEAIVAAPAAPAEPLENELTSDADRALAEAVWQSHGDFLRHMDGARPVKEAFEAYIGHELDPKNPTVVMLR